MEKELNNAYKNIVLLMNDIEAKEARIKELEERDTNLCNMIQHLEGQNNQLLEVLEDIRDSNNFTYIHIEIDKVLNRAKKD